MIIKTTVILFIGVCLSLFANGQIERKTLPPSIDQRVELLSIVFRIAGSEEYNTADNKKYILDIHQHFDPFKNHPLIKYAQLLRDSSSVGYDAVMFMAISLKEAPDLSPIIPFNIQLPDKRWSIATAEKFNILLKQFYKDADCKTFFNAEKGTYALAEKAFYPMVTDLDIDWYYKFYGKKPSENFHIIIGLGNGGTNFGPHIILPDHTKQVYAVIGAYSFDSAGNPLYDSKNTLPTLIHEFNHSFVNYLTPFYEKQLKKSGEIIYEREKSIMTSQAYGEWQTMMNEALVRAAVIQYLKNHDQDTLVADAELKAQLARGFVWINGLVNLLGKYETQRNRYPTLEKFMPEIIHFYDQVAIQINQYDEEYLKHSARVIAVEPFKNNDTTVNPGIKEIRFKFDKELDGVRYFFGAGSKPGTQYPKLLSFSFTDDHQTIIMKVELQPNTQYQINMTGKRMRTADGYPVQNYLLTFNTGEIK